MLRGILLVAKACLLTGCIIPFNGPGDIKRDVESATGSDLDMDFGLTVGRSGMALARWAIEKSDDGGDLPPLEGIRKVEVGIYHVDADRPGSSRALDAGLWPGWIPVVEVHGEGHGGGLAGAESGGPVDGDDGASADVLILFQYEEAALRRLLMLVADEEQRLVIVRVTGDLNKLIEQVIAYGLKESEHPELIDPAIESWRARQGASPAGETALTGNP